MKATDLIDDLNRRFADDDYGRRAPAALQRSSDGAVGSFQGLRLSTGVETLFAADGGISGHQAVTVVRGPHGRPLSAWVPYALALDAQAIGWLDRLVRTLHVFNSRAVLSLGRLWLAVHPLHLGAISGEFGAVFANLLARMRVHPSQIVLEIADADRMPRSRLMQALSGFRTHGFGTACVLRGDDPGAFEQVLSLHPDAVKLCRSHLYAARASLLGRERLARRIAAIRAAGAHAWLRGVDDLPSTRLARALDADGWQSGLLDARMLGGHGG